MPKLTHDDLTGLHTAEVMMEAGLSFIRSGDRKTALSFFRDAASLFRDHHDERSAEMAQGWVDAGLQPDGERPEVHAGRPALLAAGKN